VAWIGLMTTLRIFLSIDMLIERMRGFFFSADLAGIRAEKVCTNGTTGGCQVPALVGWSRDGFSTSCLDRHYM
jgi:hypothetical protein